VKTCGGLRSSAIHLRDACPETPSNRVFCALRRVICTKQKVPATPLTRSEAGRSFALCSPQHVVVADGEGTKRCVPRGFRGSPTQGA
jgi:hypothetical protein